MRVFASLITYALLLSACGGPLPSADPPSRVAADSEKPALSECPDGMALVNEVCRTPHLGEPRRPPSVASVAGPIQTKPLRYPLVNAGTFPPMSKEEHQEWARVLNGFHGHVHPLFADQYLATLEGLPPTADVNRQQVVTVVEVTLGGDGALVDVTPVRRSGIEAFDQAVLSSVRRGAPYIAPPPSLLVGGRIRFRYAFARDPVMSCAAISAAPVE